jgi:hypothetical protein
MKISFINNFNIRSNISLTKPSVSFGAASDPIYMIDETDHVSKYDSMNEVAIALGVSVETIKKALDENKKVSRVIIKRAEDFEKNKINL